MVRFFCAIFTILTASIAQAEARYIDGRTAIEVISEIGETRLSLTQAVLRSGADFLSLRGDVSPKEGHASFKAIVNGVREVRSMLALDENGMLIFDSFNVLPIEPAMNLSHRKYFNGTTGQRAKKMLIFQPITGHQSGDSFIPAAMAVPGHVDQNQKVVMAVVVPTSLLPDIDLCSFCGAAIALDGSIIASSSPMSAVNEAALGRVSFSGEYGATEIEVRGMAVLVHWRKSRLSKLIYMYYEGRPRRGGE